jgi:hypothetical protein
MKNSVKVQAPIAIGSKVICPVTDSDGEAGHAIGKLVSMNSRFAGVEIDGKIIKVGKTKIELLEEEVELEADNSKSTNGRDLSRYQPCRAASGRKSLDNGDETAMNLRGKTLEEAYDIGSQYLGETVTALKSRYSHLNPGQQRMCLGNRLRKISR